jgi:hypothetical protein
MTLYYGQHGIKQGADNSNHYLGTITIHVVTLKPLGFVITSIEDNQVAVGPRKVCIKNTPSISRNMHILNQQVTKAYLDPPDNCS